MGCYTQSHRLSIPNGPSWRLGKEDVESKFLGSNAGLLIAAPPWQHVELPTSSLRNTMATEADWYEKAVHFVKTKKPHRPNEL
jgi:hypothetical protein